MWLVCSLNHSFICHIKCFCLSFCHENSFLQCEDILVIHFQFLFYGFFKIRLLVKISYMICTLLKWQDLHKAMSPNRRPRSSRSPSKKPNSHFHQEQQFGPHPHRPPPHLQSSSSSSSFALWISDRRPTAGLWWVLVLYGVTVYFYTIIMCNSVT